MKTDVVAHQEAFAHVALLFHKPSNRAGLLLIYSSNDVKFKSDGAAFEFAAAPSSATLHGAEWKSKGIDIGTPRLVSFYVERLGVTDGLSMFRRQCGLLSRRSDAASRLDSHVSAGVFGLCEEEQ